MTSTGHVANTENLKRDLETGLHDVKRMIALLKGWEKHRYTDDEVEECDQLREGLLRKMGALEPVTTQLTGKRLMQQFGQTYGIWEMALDKRAPAHFGMGQGFETRFLDSLAELLIEAIGRLEAGVMFESQKVNRLVRIFISHGGPSAVRSKLERFIRAIGADPVVVEEQPNLGTSVNDKVLRETQDSSFAVILGTADRGSQQDGHLFPRLNVIDEIARLQSLLGKERVLLLLEEGVSVPSNVAEFVRARFTQESLDESLIQLVNELRGLGLLRVFSTRG